MKARGKITIRRASFADAVKIRNLHVKSIRELCCTDYTRQQIDEWSSFRKADVYRKAMRAGEKMWVAVLNEKIVGFSALLKRQVRAIYVHPNHTHKGIGRRLLRAVEKVVMKGGYGSIYLNSSLNAIPFYIKAGYRPGKKFSRPLPNGQGLPARRMTKLL